MGKNKIAKDKPEAAADDIAVVVFGRDEGGRAHASTFTAVESKLAERAAGLMSMRVLRVTTDEHRSVASELASGRIFASGRAFCPFVAEGTYARLEGFDEAFQPEPAAEPVAPTHTGVPRDWASIALGSLVLASEGPSRGFFEGVVVEAPGDDLFLIQWRDWPNLPAFPRRREHLAILTDDLATLTEQLDELSADGEVAAVAEA